jgi:hypothetical protein
VRGIFTIDIKVLMDTVRRGQKLVDLTNGANDSQGQEKAELGLRLPMPSQIKPTDNESVSAPKGSKPLSQLRSSKQPKNKQKKKDREREHEFGTPPSDGVEMSNPIFSTESRNMPRTETTFDTE